MPKKIAPIKMKASRPNSLMVSITKEKSAQSIDLP